MELGHGKKDVEVYPMTDGQLLVLVEGKTHTTYMQVKTFILDDFIRGIQVPEKTLGYPNKFQCHCDFIKYFTHSFLTQILATFCSKISV